MFSDNIELMNMLICWINEYVDNHSVKDNDDDDNCADADVKDKDDVDEYDHEGGGDNDDDDVVRVKEDDYDDAMAFVIFLW